MQLWLLKHSYLNCVSRSGQCIAYKYLAVILFCTVCSVTVSVFKELHTMNLAFVILFRVSVFIMALASATTSHWLCKIGAATMKHVLEQQWGTAAQERTAGQITMGIKKPNQKQIIVKSSISWCLAGMSEIRWEGVKWSGQRKIKEGVKGIGKDGERKVEHAT